MLHIKDFPINVLNVGHAEIDKFASIAYDAMHGTRPEDNDGDVTAINMLKAIEKYLGIEFFCLGFPCQDLSLNGAGNGLKWHCGACGHEYDPLTVPPEERDKCPNCQGSENISKTRSSLLVYSLEFIRKVKPKVVLIENVANFVKSAKFRPTFELLQKELESYGYLFKFDICNARDFGIPQSRNRVMIVAIHETVKDREKFKFPAKNRECPDLSYFLEDKSEEVAGATEPVIIHKSVPPYVRNNIERDLDDILTSDKDMFHMKCKSGYVDNIVGLKTTATLRAQNKTTIVLQTIETDSGTKKLIRCITPLEAFRLMGFTDEQYRRVAEKVSVTQRYKMAGNSIVVPVAEAIIEELYNAFPELFINGRFYHMFSGIGAYEVAFNNVVDKVNKKKNLL